MGRYDLHYEGRPETLFCENETNRKRLFAVQDVSGAFKDAFHDYVVHGATASVNQILTGTKAAIHHQAVVPAGDATVFRLRLTAEPCKTAFDNFDEIFAARKSEADAFYAELQKDIPSADQRLVQRQAFAGMIWSKQFYSIDVAPLARRRPGTAAAARAPEEWA
jgi:hypothetical protein